MNLIRWEPFANLRYMVDRTFEDTVKPVHLWRGFGDIPSLPIDMYQTADEVVVKATIPGIKPEDVDITISGDVLTIKGESTVEEEKNEVEYFYRERRHGSFARTINLPSDLQTDKAEAHFEDGMLTLVIPKVEEVKPKQIKVTAKDNK